MTTEDRPFCLGQVWQCRDQSLTATVMSAERPDDDVFTSAVKNPHGQITHRYVYTVALKTADGYYRVFGNHDDPADLVRLIYDPEDQDA